MIREIYIAMTILNEEDEAEGLVTQDDDNQKVTTPSNNPPASNNQSSSNRNQKLSTLFKQMMKQINGELEHLGKILTVQLKLTTTDPNAKGDFDSAYNRFHQQAESFNHSVKGIAKRIWDKKSKENNRSLESYIATEAEINSSIDDILHLNEAMVSVNSAVQQSLNWFRERLSGILSQTLRQIPNSSQSSNQKESLSKQFDASVSNFMETYKRLQKILQNLTDTEVTNQIKEKQEEAKKLLEKVQNLNKEKQDITKKQGEQAQEIEELKKGIIDAHELTEKIVKEISQYTGVISVGQEEDQHEAVKIMNKYNINPCAQDAIDQHEVDDLCTVKNGETNENYSGYLAKKILEGSNLDAKKRYYKYLLENGL